MNSWCNNNRYFNWTLTSFLLMQSARQEIDLRPFLFFFIFFCNSAVALKNQKAAFFKMFFFEGGDNYIIITNPVTKAYLIRLNANYQFLWNIKGLKSVHPNKRTGEIPNYWSKQSHHFFLAIVWSSNLWQTPCNHNVPYYIPAGNRCHVINLPLLSHSVINSKWLIEYLYFFLHILYIFKLWRMFNVMKRKTSAKHN